MKQHHWFYERGEGETDLRPLTVRSLMSPSPATLAPDDMVLDAMRVMRERGVRHIPIVGKDGRLVGLVTEIDILRKVLHGKAMTGEEKYHATLDTMLPLEDVMVREVATLRPAESIAAAVALFLDRKIRCAPIVDDAGMLQGIVTESDLMLLLKHMVE
jgi:CBS domain-containing protein